MFKKTIKGPPPHFEQFFEKECDGKFISFTKNHKEFFDEMTEWNSKQETPLNLEDKEEELTVDQKRRIEYQKEGIDMDSLIVAMWEATFEGETALAEEIQAKREAIKEKFPKEAKKKKITKKIINKK